jgi:NarL family two-component system response regulator LiaR
MSNTELLQHTVLKEKLLPLKVLVADDNELERLTFRAYLNAHSQFKMVGCATNGEEAVTLTREAYLQGEGPDIILMDITMPILDGMQATEIIRREFPNINIIMLTSHVQIDKVFNSFNQGANAYCLKDIDMETLYKVMVSKPLDNDIWVDPAIESLMKSMLRSRVATY